MTSDTLPQAIHLIDALNALPNGTLWCVGIMEDGPFARLCWPMPDGGYTGGYVEAYADTPANAIRAAIAAATGTAKTPQAVECEASQSGASRQSPNLQPPCISRGGGE